MPTATATYTHIGVKQVGRIHRGRLFGHGDYDGQFHALALATCARQPGGYYQSVCGEWVLDDPYSFDPTIVAAPDNVGSRVTCKRCRKCLGV